MHSPRSLFEFATNINLSEPACYKMQAQPCEMAFRSSVKPFSCRCASGLKTKQANSLNLRMSPSVMIKNHVRTLEILGTAIVTFSVDDIQKLLTKSVNASMLET
jgi:hypothetical protein